MEDLSVWQEFFPRDQQGRYFSSSIKKQYSVRNSFGDYSLQDFFHSSNESDSPTYCNTTEVVSANDSTDFINLKKKSQWTLC